MPIFVLTHPAPGESAPGHARYVTDGVGSCVAQVKAAAGGRDILLQAAATTQACRRAGLLDEMQLQLVPVLLGRGRQLFEDLPPDHIEFGLLRALPEAGCAAPALPGARGGLRCAHPGLLTTLSRSATVGRCCPSRSPTSPAAVWWADEFAGVVESVRW